MYRKIRKFLAPYYRYLEMRMKIVWYNNHKRQILDRLKKKEVIRVAFMTVNLSMWRCESLFRLMMADSRFEPIIVPFPRPMFNQDAEKQELLRMIDYCKSEGFPYIPGYDYEKLQFNGYDEIKPDIVFFCQPHNAAFPAHKLEAFWKDCLFFYVPYCFHIGNYTDMVNNLYMNICQLVFLENNILKDVESRMMINKGANCVVTGYLDEDVFRKHVESDNAVWKKQDSDLKRIIWAPHHSIRDIDILNFSVFLEIAEDMLSLAHKYEGSVQFAFKPHPGLKPKLYDMEGWGKERTDKYYSEWENMPNTILAEGSYHSLFRSSDALIHDSASFTVEYLYTGKPVMYLAKDDHMNHLNEFGAMCYDVHYKGRTIKDICDFVEHVVLEGKDGMKDVREKFISENLYRTDEKSPAENIMDSLVTLLFDKA